MDDVFVEAEAELNAVVERLAGDPRQLIVRLLLMALEREELVSMAYRISQIGARLRQMPLPDEVRELIEHAIVWIWKDEEMHAIYARGALLQLSNFWRGLGVMTQQMGGIVAGWASSVLHHSRWANAPLSRLAASCVVLGGRIAGKVPKAVGRELRYMPFRDFCLLNAELEKASWLSWDRLAALAEEHGLMPEMCADFHRVAEDEIRHRRVFEAIAECLTQTDELSPGATAAHLAERIALVGSHFLPGSQRDRSTQTLGSGGTVWSVAGASGEDGPATLRRTLEEAGLAAVLRERARDVDKPLAGLRVVVKTSFMLGYHQRDPTPLVDPALIRSLVEYLRQEGCADIAVAENRNLYDRFFANRTVADVARYIGIHPEGFRIVDLSEEQQPHVYGRGMGQTSVAASWRDADVRISLGKVRSHPIEMALLSLGNLEAVGGRTDQFLFAERQADRRTALMMIVDDFPVHFSVLDCFANVPDGLVGMMGCPRPRQPRRIYAGVDALAVDCVVGRHLGWRGPEESPHLRTACYWFGGWPEAISVRGTDAPILPWIGPHSNEWNAFLSLLAAPVYEWGSGRGSLFLPEMDRTAFPYRSQPGVVCRVTRSLVRGLLGLRLPAETRRSHSS